MLPSPSRRASASPGRSPLRRISVSPVRECGVAHKRGRSLESGLPLKHPKDEEPALFADMRTREREEFLVQPSDDFDESISKLRNVSDFKLSVNIPRCGESAGLLNLEADKNDYDWLLTPPETPLFHSLDDEEPQYMVKDSRGRIQNHAASLSRSSTIEKSSHISTRSNASTSRLSPSPRSSGINGQSYSRPSPTSRYSPPPVVREATPSRRPSTPTSKPSTSSRRSASPTPRRMNSSPSVGQLLPRKSGTSPVRVSRGNSASPSTQRFESNIPGFPLDAPPNLRTTPSERASTRGVSPVYTHGIESTLKYRRQSMSPTPCRTASSSHSNNDRGRGSPYGRASTASSIEDDGDSALSVSAVFAMNPDARKNSILVKSRPIASSKKPSKGSISSSAPKRSFDSALWLMDNRKTPQNMFRPLLSSVPSSSVAVGKVNSVHRPMFSRNSSLTTSSNASSEMGATVGLYMDSDHEQSDLGGEWENAEGSNVQDEMFVFDKMDILNESNAHESDGSILNKQQPECCAPDRDKENVLSSSLENSNVSVSSGDNYKGMLTCTQCGKLYSLIHTIDDLAVCEDCAAKYDCFAEQKVLALVCKPKLVHAEVNSDVVLLHPSKYIHATCGSLESSVDSCERTKDVSPQCLSKSSFSALPADGKTNNLLLAQTNSYIQDGRLAYQSEYNAKSVDLRSVSDSSEEQHPCVRPSSLCEYQRSKHTECEHPTTPEGLSDRSTNTPVNNFFDDKLQTDMSNSSILDNENPVNTGIAVLLQSSSGIKRPVVEGRYVATTGILCSEPYYARENTIASKYSYGCDNSSETSSVDISFSKQAEIHLQHLPSNRRVQTEKAYSNSLSGQSNYSVSDMSISGSSAQICTKSEAIDDLCSPFEDFESKVSRMSSTEFCSFSNEQTITSKSASSFEENCVKTNASPMCSETAKEDVEKNSSYEVNDSDHVHKNETMSSQRETLNTTPQSLCTDEPGTQPGIKVDELPDLTVNCTSIGDLDHLADRSDLEDLRNQTDITENLDGVKKLCEGSASTLDVDKTLVTSAGMNVEKSNLVEGVESTSGIAEPTQQMQRGFTLEEATDTILFCSSIVHDIAYRAAAIAMDKEMDLQLLEAPLPTISVVDRSIPRTEYTTPNRRKPSQRKVKRKRLETDNTCSSAEADESAESSATAISTTGAPKSLDSVKPPKLESKCNCTIM